MDNGIWTHQRESGSSVDFVISNIREALINKELKPGDKLPSETELTSLMQVSRGTIREAMKVLASYGLIDIQRGNGTFICKDNEKFSMDPFLFNFLLIQPTKDEQMEFRYYIEKIVMELAIKNATQDDIDQLEANYSEFLAQLDEPKLTAQLDVSFHNLLGKATKNRLVERVYAFSFEFFKAALESSHKKNMCEPAKRSHRETIDAIKNRDYESIEAIVVDNVNSWSSGAEDIFFA